MAKTLHARAKNTNRNRMRGMRGRQINLATRNALLSAQVEEIRKKENTPVLKVSQDGVILNLDYSNPQHLRWLED